MSCRFRPGDAPSIIWENHGSVKFGAQRPDLNLGVLPEGGKVDFTAARICFEQLLDGRGGLVLVRETLVSGRTPRVLADERTRGREDEPPATLALTGSRLILHQIGAGWGEERRVNNLRLL